MAEDYIVKQGDTLFNIANKFNFPNWQFLYDHADNESFKEKRPNPNCIYPGDVIKIPDKVLKEKPAPTGEKAIYTLKRKKTFFRVKLQDGLGMPMASIDYQFKIEAFDIFVEGQTDGDGLVETEVPVNAKEAELVTWPNPDDAEFTKNWNIKLGHLDPVEEVPGVQARLQNLGYNPGEVDGIMGPRTNAAIKLFQTFHELEVDGIAGEETNAKLVEAPPVVPPEGAEGETDLDGYEFMAKEMENTNEKTLRIKLVDGNGRGVPDQPFTLKHSKRKISKGKTNAFGEASIKGIISDNAIISLKSLKNIAIEDSKEYKPKLELTINEEITTKIVFKREFEFSS